MKILITSGGTSEPIDQVRAITNHSTGRLGATIAETYLQHGEQVTLITTKRAVHPQPHPNLHIVIISTVAELRAALEEQVPTHDVLIHAMAVSDYSPSYMTSLEEVQESKDLTQLLTKHNTEKKISSADEVQVLFLQKNPKLISLVKQWNPAIQLIGFKLLVDVSKDELVQVARASLEKNQADYILANDLTQIQGDQHLAYLVGSHSVNVAQTKKEIAELIYQKTKG